MGARCIRTASRPEAASHRAYWNPSAAEPIPTKIPAHSEDEFTTIRNVDKAARWPDIATRFKAIGEEISYRTTYARLCSQTHADAEDTITYIVYKCSGGDARIDQMAAETIAFSELMVVYGVYFYLLAVKALADTFGLSASTELDRSIAYVVIRMQEIASPWNW